MKRVQMVQEMSGTRPDGRAWPPAGVEFEVDDEEARFLTRTADGSSTPLAVYTEKRTETADAPEKVVETREEKFDKGGTTPPGPSTAENATGEPEEVQAPRRGRPPGSMNRPKSQ